MLHLIPRPLHVAALRIAHAVRMQWWKVSGGVVIGCRVLVLDKADRVLLIRHSYGSQRWMLPGGGLKRGEDVLPAAQREVREEVGVTLHPLVEVDFCDESLGGARNHIHVLAGWTDGAPVPDLREIAGAQFFDPDDLPANTAKSIAAGLPRWITAAKAARRAAD